MPRAAISTVIIMALFSGCAVGSYRAPGSTTLAMRSLPTPAAVIAAPAASSCSDGEALRFNQGLAALKARLGERMGTPIECERVDAASGDTLQATTSGLAYYRRATNTATFTNGWDHWALSATTVVYWAGEQVEPPTDVLVDR